MPMLRRRRAAKLFLLETVMIYPALLLLGLVGWHLAGSLLKHCGYSFYWRGGKDFIGVDVEVSFETNYV
jgi:hypothetical protein